MTLATPRQPFWLWLAGLGLWFGILPLIIYDGRLYYAEGGHSVDGPGMEFIAVGMMCVMLLPIFLAILACYLLRYRGPAPLSRFRTRSIFANLLAALAILASLFFLWIVFWRVDFWRPTRFPHVAYWLAWAIYFQYLRAAAVNRSQPRTRYDGTANVFD